LHRTVAVAICGTSRCASSEDIGRDAQTMLKKLWARYQAMRRKRALRRYRRQMFGEQNGWDSDIR